MNIDKILLLENEYLKWENGITSADKIIIYGAGKIASSLLKRLRKRNADIIGIADKDYEKAVSFAKNNGIEALRKNDWDMGMYDDVQIVVCSVSYRNEIKEELSACFAENQIKTFEFVPQISGQLAIEEYRDWLCANKERIYDFEKHLADDRSKHVLEKIIMGRYSYNFSYYEAVQSPATYFPEDIIHLTANEIFVDGGAYIGDTYEEFLESTRGKYEHYYGFEVDRDNFMCFQRRVELRENDTVLCKGLWDCNTTLFFSQSHSGTQKVNESNDNTIEMQVIKLDDYFQGKKCTMIKLDTEGCELAILRGAERTIRNYKPKLAICVYHNYADCIDIGTWLVNLNMGYHIFLRQCRRDSILFAI